MAGSSREERLQLTRGGVDRPVLDSQEAVRQFVVWRVVSLVIWLPQLCVSVGYLARGMPCGFSYYGSTRGGVG